MLTQQLELTNEQTSPLFRIMWIHNFNEPAKRHYDNNICAFHIGNGFILTVAHNLRTEATLFKSITQAIYASEILPHLSKAEVSFFEQSYPLDVATGKRYIHIPDPANVNRMKDILKRINFDTRWLTLMQRNICSPHLIIQFTHNQFYNDPALTAHFNGTNFFPEPGINKHTFLVEVELVEAFYNEDIALYRIINTHQNIIDRLPSIQPNYEVLDDSLKKYYCLQSSPSSEAGKLLNKAQIDGYLDHVGIFPDPIGGSYTFEGLRYLISGYFRFGSSGAPYLLFDEETASFKVNAIQSEACPLQLSIDNKRDGNFQYVNAIASPLSSIKDRLEVYLQHK